MAHPSVDLPALVGALVGKQTREKISWREVARQAGVGPATLTRLRDGKEPNLATLGSLIRWLGLPAEQFLPSLEESNGLAVSQILRGKMSIEAAEALAHLIESALRFSQILNGSAPPRG